MSQTFSLLGEFYETQQSYVNRRLGICLEMVSFISFSILNYSVKSYNLFQAVMISFFIL